MSSLTVINSAILKNPLLFIAVAAVLAVLGNFLHSLFTRKKQGAETASYVAHVSFLAVFKRWLKDQSLTLPDVLYQIGLSADAPLVKVSLGPSMNAYVVRSSELTAQVAKMSQHLSMLPFYELVPKIGALDRRSAAILRKDMGSRKVPNVFSEMHRAFLQSLVPGPEYNRIVRVFTSQFGENCRNLHKDLGGYGTLDPYRWLQRAWVNAMGVAAWGGDSPFLSFKVVEDWWIFRNSATTILFGVMPDILFADTRAAMRARNRILKPFSAYYKKLFENTSESYGVPQRVLQYVESGKKWGFDHNALARLDLSNTFGLFKDPIDAAYGMLVHLCSRPAVLKEVREELEAALTRSSNGKTITLHAHSIRTVCPLFASCYYEAVRLTGGGFPVRSITSDFDVDGTTFRKGGLVVLSSVAIHRDASYWPDPETFKPDRFLGVRAPEAEMQKTYRVFGGGAAICAGRHLSPPLVLTAVAALILGFDMEPVNGAGWAIPMPEHARVPEAATPPRGVGSPDLVTRTRAGFEGVEWEFCADCAHGALEIDKPVAKCPAVDSQVKVSKFESPVGVHANRMVAVKA